jgi:FtsZ-binding cell division protein ZapB
VSEKFDVLSKKVNLAVEELRSLRRENQRLKAECEALKSQVALSSGEGRKAQRILAEYDQLKRNHEQAKVRVERALAKINSLSL